MKEEAVPNFDNIFNFFTSSIKENDLLDGEAKVDELYTLCDDPMQIPVKLVDTQLRFADLSTLQNLFVENSGFLVVGAIGLQGSGKSSILNVMANSLSEECSIFNGPFNTESVSDLITNSPQTGGIDLYITQDRVILLDTQPLLSFALANYHIQSAVSRELSSKSTSTHSGQTNLTGPGSWNMDVWAEMASLQVIAFLMNVCHVVVVVSDNITTAPNHLHRLIDRAISLKPTVFTTNAFPSSIQLTDLSKNSSITTKKSGQSASKIKSGVPSSNQIQSHDNMHQQQQKLSDSDLDENSDAGDDNLGFPEHQHVLDYSHRSNQFVITEKQCHKLFETESKDLADALDRLRNLIDYSACMIHVYNRAPASAFLDPIICEKLKRYQYQVLPALYPEYRRLTALVNVGPRILTNHLLSRYHNQAMSSFTHPSQNEAPSVVAENQIQVTSANGDVDENRANMESSALPCSTFYHSERSDDGCQEIVLSHIPAALSGPRASHESDSELSMKDISPSRKFDVEPVSIEEAGNVEQTHPDCTITKPQVAGDTKITSTSIKNEEKLVKTEAKAKSSTNLNPPKSVDHSEAEIVSECCSVLQAVEKELTEQLSRRLVLPGLSAFDSNNNNASKINDSDVTIDSVTDKDIFYVSGLSGEKVNANLLEMANHVRRARRRIFDYQRRLDLPRLFLIPDVDDEGNSPAACPSYSSCARMLQEAVFSTPRQHMMLHFTEKKWITYAQKMWDAVCHSPILLDYHSVLTNQM